MMSNAVFGAVHACEIRLRGLSDTAYCDLIFNSAAFITNTAENML